MLMYLRFLLVCYSDSLCVFLGTLTSGKEGAMPKTSVVQSREHQRELLSALLQQGHAAARTVRRAHTRLLAAAQQPVPMIAAMWHTAAVTVTQTCTRWLTAGLETARSDRPRPGRHRTLDGRPAAHPVALAWRTPPAGRGR
jgi:hypothetical protein